MNCHLPAETGWTVQVFIQLLTALIALVALGVGPLVQLRIAKRQMMTPVRERWLTNLSELVAELGVLGGFFYRSHFRGDNPDKFPEELKERIETNILRIVEISTKAELLLSVENSGHQELIKSMREVHRMAMQRHSALTQFEPAFENMKVIAAKVIKAERDALWPK